MGKVIDLVATFSGAALKSVTPVGDLVAARIKILRRLVEGFKGTTILCL